MCGWHFGWAILSRKRFANTNNNKSIKWEIICVSPIYIFIGENECRWSSHCHLPAILLILFGIFFHAFVFDRHFFVCLALLPFAKTTINSKQYTNNKYNRKSKLEPFFILFLLWTYAWNLKSVAERTNVQQQQQQKNTLNWRTAHQSRRNNGSHLVVCTAHCTRSVRFLSALMCLNHDLSQYIWKMKKLVRVCYSKQQ